MFKKVLTITFDSFQYQNKSCSWDKLIEFDKDLAHNIISLPVLMSTTAKGNIKPFLVSELLPIYLTIIIANAGLILAKDIMQGKQLYLVSEDDEQITFCDSGVIVEGEHYNWSDIHINADTDKDNDCDDENIALGKLSLETDSDCYTISANSDINISQFILYRTFEYLQEHGSLNIPISLSEKLFKHSQQIKWDIVRQVVHKHNGGVFSFPVQVK